MLNLIGQNPERGLNHRFLALESYLGSWSKLMIAPSLVVIDKYPTQSLLAGFITSFSSTPVPMRLSCRD